MSCFGNALCRYHSMYLHQQKHGTALIQFTYKHKIKFQKMLLLFLTQTTVLLKSNNEVQYILLLSI